MSPETADLNFVSAVWVLVLRSSLEQSWPLRGQLFFFFKLRRRFLTLAAHVCRPACSFFSGKGACTLSPTTPRLICSFDDEDSSHRFHRQHFCLTKGRAWATSRVYRRAAALDSHRINHRRWFCAASIATHIWSRRDRAIRIFNFPPKRHICRRHAIPSLLLPLFRSSRISGQ